MTSLDPSLQAIVHTSRKVGKESYARWDDLLFDRYLEEHIAPLWSRLERRDSESRPQSLQHYIGMVVAGIGAGYLTAIDGPASSLMEAFLRDRLPWWLIESSRDRHGKIAQSIWNLAEGARKQGLWVEQYLLACVDEFDNPMQLQDKAVELLEPVIRPRPAARWLGPFSATTLDLRSQVEDFLPDQITQINPALIYVSDRRKATRIGVLLLPQGESRLVGQMSGDATSAHVPQALDTSIQWGDGHVYIGNERIELPLMGCLPMTTLAVSSGYLIASAENSQRLWILDSP
jgi:hypothetical protein